MWSSSADLAGRNEVFVMGEVLEWNVSIGAITLQNIAH